ncbi:LysR family transcriptional regulator [Roseibium sp. SCPC15]|uniref:LysR family transcriptional regulator n=1 Tax=Roseibium sp. SCP15 TaxID=3141376 RepID=UPI00333B2A19
MVMRAFCRIVERGSLVRASEDLGVTSGLLSRELKLLEKSLGCTLITRTTRTMALTAQGMQYYDEATAILDQIEKAEERVKIGVGQIGGRLKVNVPHSFGTAVLANFIPGFCNEHPDVDLTICFDDNVIDMVQGGFDLSIRIRAELPDSGLVTRRIGSVKQALFASPNYLAEHPKPTTPDELLDHDLIVYSLADSTTTWNLQKNGEEIGIRPSPRHRIGSSLALRDLLISGLGIGTLPDFLSDEAERTGKLTRILPDWNLPLRTIYALTGSRLGFDTRSTAFIDHLSSALTTHS